MPLGDCAVVTEPELAPDELADVVDDASADPDELPAAVVGDELAACEPEEEADVEPEPVELVSGSMYCWSPAEEASAIPGAAVASAKLAIREIGAWRRRFTVASIASDEAAGLQ